MKINKNDLNIDKLSGMALVHLISLDYVYTGCQVSAK